MPSIIRPLVMSRSSMDYFHSPFAFRAAKDLPYGCSKSWISSIGKSLMLAVTRIAPWSIAVAAIRVSAPE